MNLELMSVAGWYGCHPQFSDDLDVQPGFFERFPRGAFRQHLTRIDAASWDRPTALLRLCTTFDEQHASLCVNDDGTYREHDPIHALDLSQLPLRPVLRRTRSPGTTALLTSPIYGNRCSLRAFNREAGSRWCMGALYGR